MRMFWINLSKQKFMNWAAGLIVFYYVINSISEHIYLSSNMRLLTPAVYERMISELNSRDFQIVMMVLLYFFGTKNGSDNSQNDSK